MKNRLLLSLSLLAFALLIALYSFGILDGVIGPRDSGAGALSGWTGGGTSPSAMSTGPAPVTEPSADNVSTTYFQQVNDLENFLAQNPEDTTHILRLARMYAAGHQPQKAVDWLERYMAIAPDDVQVLLDLANLHGQAAQWEKALAVTDKLLQIDPGHPKARYNKGAIMANLGNIEEAGEIWSLLARDDRDPTIASQASQSLERLTSP